MKQKTLFLIKPNAVKKACIGDILRIIEENNFIIDKLLMLHMDKELAVKFYEVHFGKPFYNELVKFMTSGKIVAIVLEREDAVTYLREVVGNTDPSKAEKGTLRFLYGDSLTQNAVHASDSLESAKREINLIFA